MAHSVIVKLSELRDAFDFVSSGAPTEHEAYLSIQSGEFHWHSTVGDNEEELPADVNDESAYFSVPHRNDLGLGKRLALQFASAAAPELLADVREAFSRRGAYARFKNLLAGAGKLDQWHRYEEVATVEALRQWCEDNAIEIDG